MRPVPRSRAYGALLAIADRVDERLGPDGAPGPVAAGVGAVELLATAAALPMLGLLVEGRARRATREVHRRIERWPDVLADVATPGTVRVVPGGGVAAVPEVASGRSGALGSVERLPASAEVVITSDLHRAPPGLMDLPAAQGVAGIYAAMLSHYAERGWTLVENGDVEDFWLRGGSTYGVVYGIGRCLGRWRGRRERRWGSASVFAEHLARTVRANAALYGLIQDGFHAPGRYVRLIGNHDDVYEDPAVVDALGRVHPGIAVHEYLALDRESPAGATRAEPAAAVVTHGHQWDAWNAPDMAWLGRFGTWLACAIGDAPWPEVRPGVPTAAETEQLLGGRQPNRLTAVSRTYGADRDLYSLDEVLLLDALRRRWRPGTEPWIVFGHTHLPVCAPRATDGTRRRYRYCNSGSGLGAGVVTAVEWTRGDDQVAPAPLLVAWHRAGPGVAGDVITTCHDGVDYVRRTLEPVDGGRRLAPR